MKEISRTVLFSPGASKVLDLKDEPGEIKASSGVEFLWQISNGKPRAVVVAESNHKKMKEFCLLASTAKASLGAEFSLVLYREFDGAVPSEFDKQIRSLNELSSL